MIILVLVILSSKRNFNLVIVLCNVHKLFDIRTGSKVFFGSFAEIVAKTVIEEMSSDAAKTNFPRTFIPKPHMLLMIYRPASQLLGDKGLYSVECGHSAAQQSLIRCCGTRTRRGVLWRDRAVTRTICRRAWAARICAANQRRNSFSISRSMR